MSIDTAHDHPPQSELHSPHLVILNEAKLGDLNGLRERISLNGGRVSIIVHPHLIRPDDYESRPAPYELERQWDDLFVTSTLSPQPVILFEEARRTGRSRYLVNRARPGSYFIVTTAEDNPIPVSIDDYQNRRFSAVDIARWNPILKLFRELGITSAEVGGQFLSLIQAKSDDEKARLSQLQLQAGDLPLFKVLLERGILPSGCVGTVITKLAENNIDVSISPLTYPNITL